MHWRLLLIFQLKLANPEESYLSLITVYQKNQKIETISISTDRICYYKRLVTNMFGRLKTKKNYWNNKVVITAGRGHYPFSWRNKGEVRIQNLRGGWPSRLRLEAGSTWLWELTEAGSGRTRWSKGEGTLLCWEGQRAKGQGKVSCFLTIHSPSYVSLDERKLKPQLTKKG